MSGKQAQLTEMLEPAVAALGYELWGLEYISGGNQPMIRIYIESPNGITVDDCAATSRQVSAVLDVEDPIRSEFRLEVSSPGVDRPLFKEEHYIAHLGHRIKVVLRYPFEGRRNFTGILTGIEDDDVVLVVDDNEYLLPLSGIDKAQLLWAETK
ncbi:MAG: ribosome maturation factor RimP [Pseudomonadales bacterium]